jgi:hypothetical protein
VWHYDAIEYRGADRRVSMTERCSLGAVAGVGSWCYWVDAGAVAIRSSVVRQSQPAWDPLRSPEQLITLHSTNAAYGMPCALAQEPPVPWIVRPAPKPSDVVVGLLCQLDDAHPCLAVRSSHRTGVATSPTISRVGIAVGADSATTVQPRLTGNTAASAIGLICSRIHAAAATTGPARARGSLRHRLTSAPLAALLVVLRLSALAPVAALAFTASRLAPPGFCHGRIVRVGQPQEAKRRGEHSQGPAPGASDEKGAGQGIKTGSVHDWCSLGLWPARTGVESEPLPALS